MYEAALLRKTPVGVLKRYNNIMKGNKKFTCVNKY